MTELSQELAALQRLTVGELRHRYGEVFGEATQTGNRPWLIKRIAWRLQSLQEGDISERARQRAAELARDADVRMSPPKVPGSASNTEPQLTTSGDFCVAHDSRLPPPGTVLVRHYKQQTYYVTVLPSGFEFEQEIFRSLTAVTKRITGQHCNGYRFFRLDKGTTSR